MNPSQDSSTVPLNRILPRGPSRSHRQPRPELKFKYVKCSRRYTTKGLGIPLGKWNAAGRRMKCVGRVGKQSTCRPPRLLLSRLLPTALKGPWLLLGNKHCSFCSSFVLAPKSTCTILRPRFQIKTANTLIIICFVLFFLALFSWFVVLFQFICMNWGDKTFHVQLGKMDTTMVQNPYV